jgi:hypothetical protein
MARKFFLARAEQMAHKDLRAYLKPCLHQENPGDESTAEGTHEFVLRAPGGYACGLCHSRHDEFWEAQQCVQCCALHYRLRARIHVLSSLNGEMYRCALCARVRVHKQDALRCFEKCRYFLKQSDELPEPLQRQMERLESASHETHGHKERRARIHAPLFRRPRQWLQPESVPTQESETKHINISLKSGAIETHMPINARGSAKTPTAPSAKPEDAFASVPQRAISQAEKDDLLLDGLQGVTFEEPSDESHKIEGQILSLSAQAQADALAEAQEAKIPPPKPEISFVAPAEPIKDKNGEVLFRVPGQKPFKRADAKYVCTVCATKYFTKGDVEACFQSHPLKDEV